MSRLKVHQIRVADHRNIFRSFNMRSLNVRLLTILNGIQLVVRTLVEEYAHTLRREHS